MVRRGGWSDVELADALAEVGRGRGRLALPPLRGVGRLQRRAGAPRGLLSGWLLAGRLHLRLAARVHLAIPVPGLAGHGGLRGLPARLHGGYRLRRTTARRTFSPSSARRATCSPRRCPARGRATISRSMPTATGSCSSSGPRNRGTGRRGGGDEAKAAPVAEPPAYVTSPFALDGPVVVAATLLPRGAAAPARPLPLRSSSSTRRPSRAWR